MKIIGIGTDMVSLKRIESIWHRFGLRFAHRILTRAEFEECQQLTNPVAFLGKRFAAKEALAKALGTGFRPNGLLLTQIGVTHETLGKPKLVFYERTLEQIQQQGILESHVSLSDEKEFALAFVILVGK